jgi:hypothetical protein
MSAVHGGGGIAPPNGGGGAAGAPFPPVTTGAAGAGVDEGFATPAPAPSAESADLPADFPVPFAGTVDAMASGIAEFPRMPSMKSSLFKEPASPEITHNMPANFREKNANSKMTERQRSDYPVLGHEMPETTALTGKRKRLKFCRRMNQEIFIFLSMLESFYTCHTALTFAGKIGCNFFLPIVNVEVYILIMRVGKTKATPCFS